MSTYKVTLIGHRFIEDIRELEDMLRVVIDDILLSNRKLVWYIGRNGDFDICAASLLKRMMKQRDDIESEIILVLPYLVKDSEFYEEYYDEVMIPDSCYYVHPKRAITERNRWMIDNSDIILFAVKGQGGAASAMRYASRKGKRYINIFDSLNQTTQQK